MLAPEGTRDLGRDLSPTWAYLAPGDGVVGTRMLPKTRSRAHPFQGQPTQGVANASSPPPHLPVRLGLPSRSSAHRRSVSASVEHARTRRIQRQAAPTTDGARDAAWALVRAAQEGDADAFGRLYDRYVDMVFRFVLFKVGDRALAEDVTSETFLRALRRISSVSDQGRDVGAWFITIARNLVLDHVKSSRSRLEVTTADIGDAVAGAGAPGGPEHEVVTAATNAELMRCVAKLAADQQECIVLRFLQGLSVAETAAIMGRNEGAVKALQHRAVRRLAQLLPEGLR